MKKTISVMLILLITNSILATPAWNPWNRHWTFEVDGVQYNYRIVDVHKAHNLDTGEIHLFIWNSEHKVAIADFFGEDLHVWMKLIEMSEGEDSCTLVIIDEEPGKYEALHLGEEVRAWSHY